MSQPVMLRTPIVPALTFEQRRIAVADLNKFCAPERWAHLILSVVTATILIVMAVMIFQGPGSWKSAISLFGGGGVIALSQGRVMMIWNQMAGILLGTWPK